MFALLFAQTSGDNTNTPPEPFEHRCCATAVQHHDLQLQHHVWARPRQSASSIAGYSICAMQPAAARPNASPPPSAPRCHARELQTVLWGSCPKHKEPLCLVNSTSVPVVGSAASRVSFFGALPLPAGPFCDQPHGPLTSALTIAHTV